MMRYDVIIVGTGPAGIFTALELKKNAPNKKILMLEKGNRIEDRNCPKRQTFVCRECPQCSITTGFAGAGAYSDGKLILSQEIGGNLSEYLGEELNGLIQYVDDIYLSYGADRVVYGRNQSEVIARLKRKAIQSNLKPHPPYRH